MKKYFLYFAWVISLIAFIFSFYYGEIFHLDPCRLCWYQRIALFPLTFILGVAIYQNDREVFRYAFPLALFGTFVAFYQALSIHFPFLQQALECGKECAKPIFVLWGWITFPDLSFIAFLLISAFIWVFHKSLSR
jgi:disulfide bond formation protein DsbB